MKRTGSTVSKVEKRWLTTTEAGKYLGFANHVTQREWRDTGQLRYYQVGRTILYDKADLDKFVEKHRITP